MRYRTTSHDTDRKKTQKGKRVSTEEETATPRKLNMEISLGKEEDISPATYQPTDEQYKPEPTLF